MINRLASSARRRRYPFWLNLHLWIGLSLGLVFVLAGLTGSLLVFYVELDEILNPELQISAEEAQQPKQTLETLYQSLRNAHPERTGAWRLEMPRHNQTMVLARYYKAKETQHLHFAPLMAWVNPYTAEVVSTRFWGEFAMTWIYDLHFSLLLDKTGLIIMGISGLFLLMSIFAGIYLWWPKTGKLLSAIIFKPKASRERFIYDLHKVSGVYGFIFLFLLLLSGVILELPDYVNPLINHLSPLAKNPKVTSMSATGRPRITLDEAATAALSSFPQAKLRWLETPADENSSYHFRLYQDGEPGERFPKTFVWIDQYSGKILAIRNPRLEQAGDTFLNWMHPLHSGEIAGLTGRICVFFSGLLPLILFYTGLIRWLQKRTAKQKTFIHKRLS